MNIASNIVMLVKDSHKCHSKIAITSIEISNDQQYYIYILMNVVAVQIPR